MKKGQFKIQKDVIYYIVIYYNQYIGIRNEQDLEYLLNQGFETEKRPDSLSLYPIDLKYNCMWLCKLGYSPEKYYHFDPYITIEELKYKKGESLNIVNKMLEILEEYEHK